MMLYLIIASAGQHAEHTGTSSYCSVRLCTLPQLWAFRDDGCDPCMGKSLALLVWSTTVQQQTLTAADLNSGCA